MWHLVVSSLSFIYLFISLHLCCSESPIILDNYVIDIYFHFFVAVRMLLDAGADPNQKDIIGNTPLHLGQFHSTYRSKPQFHLWSALLSIANSSQYLNVLCKLYCTSFLQFLAVVSLRRNFTLRIKVVTPHLSKQFSCTSLEIELMVLCFFMYPYLRA